MRRSRRNGARRGATIAFVMLVAALSHASGARAASLVSDGNFEQTVVSPPGQEFNAGQTFGAWTVTEGTMALGASPTAVAPNGPQYVSFNLNAMYGQQPATVVQDLATEAEARYRLRFAYAGDPAIAAHPGCEANERVKKFAAVWGDQTLPHAFDTTGRGDYNFGWKYADVLVEAPAATTRLGFKSLHDGNCGATIDDVSVTDPPPSLTGTSLTTSRSPTVFGQAVTFTATVLAAEPSETPAGAVQFSDRGTALGAPVPLDASGRAAKNTATLAPGTHEITASFTPSSPDRDPSQAQITQIVDKADTSTAFSISPNPSVAGEPARFTALVTPAPPSAGAPRGTVQFSEDDGSPIGGPQPIDATGHASITASAGAGEYRLRASYSGDANFNASIATVPQTVEKATTVTSLSSSRNPVPAGEETTLTAVVEIKPPGDVDPYGALIFSINGLPASDPIPLEGADGIEVTLTAPDTAGTDTIGVAYTGDANTRPSEDSLVQTVADGQTTAPATVTPPASNPTPASPVVALPASDLTKMVGGLTKALRNRGFAALSSARQKLTAPTPGTLQQKVYSPRAPRSSLAARRKLLIASGRKTFSKAGTGTLRLRLTTAGRRALHRTKSLRIEIVTRFTPTAGKPVTVIHRLRVKAKGRSASARETGWHRQPRR